ncbi:hypothetical protein [Streptomyces sp. NPDC051554]|uniref:hypothetical protein n=1 Tax=Streptomyces sp. NPDC051554 TaxID=3365656 RepID=UPI003789E4F7
MEGEQSLRGTGERALTGSLPLPLADVRLLPPLQPPTVRDYMTFESHVAGIAQGYDDTVPDEWYEAPAFYFVPTCPDLGKPHSRVKHVRGQTINDKLSACVTSSLRRSRGMKDGSDPACRSVGRRWSLLRTAAAARW